MAIYQYIIGGSGNSSDGVSGALKKALKDLSKKPAPQQGIEFCKIQCCFNLLNAWYYADRVILDH